MIFFFFFFFFADYLFFSQKIKFGILCKLTLVEFGKIKMKLVYPLYTDTRYNDKIRFSDNLT